MIALGCAKRMSELREALDAVKASGELREALDAYKGGTRKTPLEVWLRQLKAGFGIVCDVVHTDESTGSLSIDSLSMRGAQREITGWLIARGYEPAGRWESNDDGESMRRFKPTSGVPAIKMRHDSFVEASAFVEVWNARGENVGERQPCRFAWRLSDGGGEYRLLTPHRIPLAGEGGGRNLVVVDESGALLWASPIAGFPICSGELIAGPFGS